MEAQKIKILLSKPGLDGHDVGVKVIAHALIDAGFEVFYTGLRKSIEEIVEMGLAKQVDLIGLSILSGTHLLLSERMKEALSSRGANIPWVVGGNIPHQDLEKIEVLGAAKAFPTGATMEEVVNYFRNIKVVV